MKEGDSGGGADGDRGKRQPGCLFTPTVGRARWFVGDIGLVS